MDQEGLSRGEVTGFIIFFADNPEQAIYFSGDTVWYQGVAEVAKRFPIRVALLNLGAARVPEVGNFHLTMTASEAVQAANEFFSALIIPLLFEGWAHFSEGREDIAAAFADAGVDRLRWRELGRAIVVAL
jgi:L-ascorbate metabolism protein UlaG (beta-lactamase superfamily)